MNAPRERALSVLLVEDNPADADLVQEYLADPGPHRRQSRVVHCASLGAARDHLEAREADVVLLDLRLPDGSDVACVEAIRSQVPQTPIVVLTGVNDESLALDCIAAGAQDYLPKDELRPAALRRAIGYAMARSREKRERHRADSLQELLAAIVEASSDAIISCDLDGTITSWNAGAERILGYTRAEAIGRPATELMAAVDAADGELQAQIFARLSSGEQSTIRFEQERRHKDGHSVWLSIAASGLRDASGRVSAISSIGRDVTAARERDHELREKNLQLEQRGQELLALAARVEQVREEERTRISREVHDGLGQLLTALKMDLRWVQRRLSEGGPAQEALAGRVTEADKLADQIIVQVQRIALELRPSALDALGLVPAMRDELRRFEARTGVDCFLDVQGDPRPSMAIGTAMFRILQELLTNVARHAKASALNVSLTQADGHCCLRVTDDGVGIGKAAARSRKSLGLLSMRERAEALGGRFEVVDEAGGGTTASACIPLSRGAA